MPKSNDIDTDNGPIVLVGNENEQIYDLDDYLETGSSIPAPTTTKPLEYKPTADKVAVVGIFVDNSISMSGLRRAVIDGLCLCADAFRGAKGSDFFLIISGFEEVYFQGFLRDLENPVFDGYRAWYTSTPLVKGATEQLNSLIEQSEKFVEVGIPTTISQLIITDGLPYMDALPKKFKEKAQQATYLVGMGCSSRGDDKMIAEYNKLFNDMGIANVITPNSSPADVRHAINQFSQSVAALATS